jgi:hypothetical protein
MLGIYARSHRKDGRPYLAEALHPDTGSFEGHDGYNHSEHYLHSGYCDLVITGLIGLIPRADDTLELHPLAPADWDYFALDDVPYRGYLLSIVWDKSGQRYGMGSGLHILVDGEKIFSSEELSAVELPGALPLRESPTSNSPATVIDVNFAVNNDGHYYPRLTASFTAAGTSLSKLQDGNYWYLLHPPNRWTSQGSPQDTDWIEVDLGVPREIHTVQLYVLDDRSIDDSWIRAPERIVLESWDGATWQPLGLESEQPAAEGGRPHVFHLEPTTVQRLRVTLVHVTGFRSGLTEIEVWGPAQLPLAAAPPPAGNLAYNDGQQAFPRATASHHDRFGGVPRSAIDGITNFSPTPTNRWTSYESKTTSDWLQIDFGQPTEFRRVELGIYDDRGGVQPPDRFEIQYWDDQDWVAVEDLRRAPEQPVGSQWNSAVFRPVTSRQLRIVFTHRGDARSGVTEVMVWND